MKAFKQHCCSHFLQLSIPFLMIPLFSSCIHENAFDITEDESGKVLTLWVFGNLSLNYDFSKYASFEFENDRIEIINSHPRIEGINFYSDLTGKIDNFLSIYHYNNTGMIEDSRLGSITLIANLVNKPIEYTPEKKP